MTMLVAVVVLSLCVVCVHCTRTRGEYVPSTMEAMLSTYQVNYLPEWAMYGTTCTYTRMGEQAWMVDARMVDAYVWPALTQDKVRCGCGAGIGLPEWECICADLRVGLLPTQ